MSKLKEFEFKYQGSNFIDLNTLLTSQFHFLSAVNELQRQLHPEAKLNLKVAGFNQGSFVVQMLAETSWLESIFNQDTVDVVSQVLGGFASYLAIHEFLKGSKPEAIQEGDENITIVANGNKNKITVNKQVFNIYKENRVLSKSVQQNFELLAKDSEIEGIQISELDKDKRNEVVSVESSKFEEFSAPNPYSDKETMEEIVLNETVFIKKPNLIPDRGKTWKWDLIYKATDITANMLDKKLEQKINDGLKIGQGDRFVADIKIYLKFDERFNTYVRTNKYDILRVHELIGRSDQTTIDF